jgi:hypothetical protein
MSMHVSPEAWPAARPFLEHVETAIAQSRTPAAAA